MCWLILLPGLSACQADVALDPNETQRTLQAAWTQAQQGTWDLHWENAPVPGNLIFEAWRYTDQRRYEILAANAPDLVGLVYVDDGDSTGYLNRLRPDNPQRVQGHDLPFSPISDAFDVIDTTLATPPQAARQQGATHTYELTYENGSTLRLRLNEAGLIWWLAFDNKAAEFTLTARQVVPLAQVPNGLFELPDRP